MSVSPVDYRGFLEAYPGRSRQDGAVDNAHNTALAFETWLLKSMMTDRMLSQGELMKDDDTGDQEGEASNNAGFEMIKPVLSQRYAELLAQQKTLNIEHYLKGHSAEK